jgi:hypothetical protein
MMTKAKTHSRTGAIVVLGAAALVSVAGCNSVPIPTTIPTAQSIAGLAPADTERPTETFVGGSGEGNGILAYRGKKYPFRLIGTVVGPGSVSKADVAGDVYKLDDISEFPGPYAQGPRSGRLGDRQHERPLAAEQSRRESRHLTGTQSGVTLSLGRDEILIKMVQ